MESLETSRVEEWAESQQGNGTADRSYGPGTVTAGIDEVTNPTTTTTTTTTTTATPPRRQKIVPGHKKKGLP
ncbi:hypothetical protein EYF80_038911 [Liparis tanakae]|uniref:Uncharacterized protein n=1 Tax=Liparis tanakae TaxID=230148 RepID=A0A4Z2GB90_9TELE|nr:hypothetical protein EYF80_038911 [Liparis tanakae]